MTGTGLGQGWTGWDRAGTRLEHDGVLDSENLRACSSIQVLLFSKFFGWITCQKTIDSQEEPGCRS
jgi:hypothetical protein